MDPRTHVENHWYSKRMVLQQVRTLGLGVVPLISFHRTAMAQTVQEEHPCPHTEVKFSLQLQYIMCIDIGIEYIYFSIQEPNI